MKFPCGHGSFFELLNPSKAAPEGNDKRSEGDVIILYES